MKINPAGLAIIKKYEGCELKSYLCPAQVWTIGYGHTGPEVRKGLQITQDQADRYLATDIAKFEESVSRLVTVPLSENQFSALVSFCYNIGPGKFGDSSLLRLLNVGRYEDAAEQFKVWIYGGGVKLPGLVKRRDAEKALFLQPHQL